MAELEYFVVSRAVSRDLGSDELSFLGVLEDIKPVRLPGVLPRVVAVSVWRITEEERAGEFQAMLRILRPGEVAAEATEFSMNLAQGHLRYRAIQMVTEIPVEQPGFLSFEVLLNGHHAASHLVTIHPPEETGEIPESGPSIC